MGKKSTGNGRVKRNYKDSVFRALFRDKKALLSLYNAVNGSSYTNTEDLEIYTLENAIYMNMKNDVSFLFDCSLTLYEHQSTYNPNLPLRYLFYMADLLKRYTVGMNLYSSTKVRIPTPRFVVFYNGTDWKEEKKVLCLSDLFLQPTENPDLELRVMMYNINYGMNSQILEQCQQLREYMILVERIRAYAPKMGIQKAANRAVDECIKEGILRKFLLENKAEVIAMSIYEYDEEEHMKAERQEHYALGYSKGKEEGREEGFRAGEESGKQVGIQQGKEAEVAHGIAVLIESYQEDGMSMEKTRDKLQNKYHLSLEEAERYMEMHWKKP